MKNFKRRLSVCLLTPPTLSLLAFISYPLIPIFSSGLHKSVTANKTWFSDPQNFLLNLMVTATSHSVPVFRNNIVPGLIYSTFC